MNPMDVTWSDLLWLKMIGALKNWTLLDTQILSQQPVGVENGNSILGKYISIFVFLLEYPS